MEEFRARNKIHPDLMSQMVGKMLRPEDLSMKLTGPVRILKPDGKPLCVYLPGAISKELRDASFPTLHELQGSYTSNRGLASGAQRVKGVSKTTYARSVDSAIIGSFDRSARFDFCRLTAWTGSEMEKWQGLWPLLQEIARHLQEHVPERYAAQARAAQATAPEWVIPGTPFTTVTVNNCVDASTECLTKRLGWTTYDQLEEGDEILSYEPATNTTSWDVCQGKFVNEEYRGDMTLLTSGYWSALTTPDHRWPVRRLPAKINRNPLKQNRKSLSKRGEGNPMYGKRKYLSWGVVHTNELPFEGWCLVRGADFDAYEPPLYSDEFVKVVAWYVTEGSYDVTRIGISQSMKANPDLVEEIRSDLIAIGAQSLEGVDPKARHKIPGRKGNARREGLFYREGQANQWPDMVGWGITGTRVDEIIRCAPGVEKIPTMEFLSSLNQNQARLFVDTCIKGDGTKSKRNIWQVVPGRTEAFQIAAVLAGHAPTMTYSEDGGAGCSLNENRTEGQDRTRIWLESVKRQDMFYDGPIWCPQVPSGHWVARRNGQTFVTGNTYATGVHTDKGDLDAGFSTIAVFKNGDYEGGTLCFPEYRVGVDLQDCDLILMDAHEWHGNIEFTPQPERDTNGRLLEDPGFERISIVTYFRTAMESCGSAKDEAERQVAFREQRQSALLGE